MEGQIISTYILPIVLALIMFNLGLSLTFERFRDIFKNPKALIVGLFCQMILLPVIAFSIAWFSNLPYEFKIGIILIAICPGGATSNLITYLLKGDVALSISLSSINSLLILFSIPLFLYLGVLLFNTGGEIISLPFFKTVGNVFVMIFLPVFLGIIYKHKLPESAKKIEQVLKYLSILLLALVFAFAMLLNKNGDQSLWIYYETVAPHVIALNLGGMFTGLFVGRLFRFNKATLIALPVEIGIQNSTLAITIAISASFMNTPLMSVPAIVYGMFTFFSALVFGYFVNKLIPTKRAITNTIN